MGCCWSVRVPPLARPLCNARRKQSDDGVQGSGAMAAAGSADREREYGRLYPVAKAIIGPVFNVAWKFNVEGLANVPTDGPAIMCPNHTSVLDSFFLPAVLPRRI